MFTSPVCGPMNSPFSQLFCASSTDWRRIRASREVAVFRAAGHGTAGKAPSTGRVRLIGSGADRQSNDWQRRSCFLPVLLSVGVCGSASQLCSARHVRRLAAWRRLHKVCGCWGMDGDRAIRRRALQNPLPLGSALQSVERYCSCQLVNKAAVAAGSSCAARYSWLFG